MKLRIKGNSARLRLSRTEVGELAAGKDVSESIAFGPLPEDRLIYRVVVADDPSGIAAALSDGVITFTLPASAAREWAAGDEVSIEFTKMVGDGAELTVLIEKDFACLNPRRGEDEGDMFPNPNAGTAC